MIGRWIAFIARDWWSYVLAKPLTWTAFVCRWRGHPEGMVWWNAGGLEPDTHCINCGDDIG